MRTVQSIFLAALLVISFAANSARADLGVGVLIGLFRALDIQPALLNFYRDRDAPSEMAAAGGGAAATAGAPGPSNEYEDLLQGLSEEDGLELAFNFIDAPTTAEAEEHDGGWVDLGETESVAGAGARAGAAAVSGEFLMPLMNPLLEPHNMGALQLALRGFQNNAAVVISSSNGSVALATAGETQGAAPVVRAPAAVLTVSEQDGEGVASDTHIVTYLKVADESALLALGQAYHSQLIPHFILEMLNLDEREAGMQKLREYPDSMAWSESGDFVILINPRQMPAKKEGEYSPPIRQLKDLPGGLVLLGWFIHPELLRGTPFDHAYIHRNQPGITTRRAPERITYSDVESGFEPYLITLLDLNEAHVGYLEKIKCIMMEKLIRTYGVDPAEDQINLYFHFPTSVETSSLHLHARVNQVDPPAEALKTFTIDDVIQTLKNHQPIAQLILNRPHENIGNCLFVGSFTLQMANLILSIESCLVKNNF